MNTIALSQLIEMPNAVFDIVQNTATKFCRDDS